MKLLFFIIFLLSVQTQRIIVTKGDLVINNELLAEEIHITDGFGQLTCKEAEVHTLTSNSMNSDKLQSEMITVDSIYPLEYDFVEFLGLMNVKGAISWGEEDEMEFENVEENLDELEEEVQESLEEEQDEEILEFDDNINEDTDLLELDEFMDWESDGSFISQDYESEQNNKMMFLQTNQFILNGVKQWVEKFNEHKYNEKPLTQNAKEITLYTKKLDDLGDHKHVRIQNNLYFYSQFWSGEAVFMKVDGKIVWLNHIDMTESEKVHKCDEISYENIMEQQWHTPVDVIVNHKKSSIEIEIGVMNPQQFQEFQKRCEKTPSEFLNQLYSIEDIQIYVK